MTKRFNIYVHLFLDSAEADPAAALVADGDEIAARINFLPQEFVYLFIYLS